MRTRCSPPKRAAMRGSEGGAVSCAPARTPGTARARRSAGIATNRGSVLASSLMRGASGILSDVDDRLLPAGLVVGSAGRRLVGDPAGAVDDEGVGVAARLERDLDGPQPVGGDAPEGRAPRLPVVEV